MIVYILYYHDIILLDSVWIKMIADYNWVNLRDVKLIDLVKAVFNKRVSRIDSLLKVLILSTNL